MSEKTLLTLNVLRPEGLARLLPVGSVAAAVPAADPTRRQPDFSEGHGQSSSNSGASLSATGRFLGALAPNPAPSTAALSLTGLAPVLAGPSADTRQLPRLLREALTQSGLFYESHQAQWLAGKRTLGQLLQEPQGRLSPATSPHTAGVIETPSLGTSSGPETAATGAARRADAPAHEQTLTLVQQQLNALETGQLSWRGEIWPGLWLEWNIAERPPAASEGEEPSRWQTRLRVTLPRLGEVAATLGLDPGGVHVALSAAAAETAKLLQGSQKPLAAAMVNAGLNVFAVEVRHDAGK